MDKVDRSEWEIMDADESLKTMLARSGTAPDYTMGVLQKETGIAPETLRTWENRYGFPNPARTHGNHRLYTGRDIVAVRWLMEQTRRGQSIRNAIAFLKRHLPDEESEPSDAASIAAPPLDRLTIVLGQGDLAEAQARWDDLVLALSPDAIGRALLRLHQTPGLPERANAFLLRKATVLLDAACPDTGDSPVAIITAGEPDAALPATVAAAALARAGHRILLPFPAITSLADISAVRDFGAKHALLIDIPEPDTAALRALLPDIQLRDWNPGEDPIDQILDHLMLR